MNPFKATAGSAQAALTHGQDVSARPTSSGIAPRPAWDVFVSYAREDVEVARALRDRLEQDGWRAFLSDDDLAAHVGSRPWSERIDQVLDATCVLVLLVTPHALLSEWVAYEWRSVHTSSLSGRRGTVVPVCWEGPSPDELPRALRRYQAIDARAEDTREEQLVAMSALVRGCLSERAAQPSLVSGVRTRQRTRPRARTLLLAVAVLLLLAGAVGRELLGARAQPGVARPPPALPLREPQQGLRTVNLFERGERAQSLSPSDWQQAERDFALAARQPAAPKRWLAAQQLAAGEAKWRSGNNTEAEACLARAVALDPDWAVAHVALSEVLLARDPEAAQTEARRARRLDAGLVIAVDALAHALFYAGKRDRALEEYRRALALSPESKLRKGNLAFALHRAGDAFEAEAQRLATEALNGDAPLVLPRLVLAQSALTLHRPAIAVELAQAAVRLAPRDIRAHLLLGDALQIMGKSAEAREAWSAVRGLSESTWLLGVERERLTEVLAALNNHEMPPRRGEARPAARATATKGRSAGGKTAAPATAHRSGGIDVTEL